jgi:Porphyromonas-type peptidyl-arginine deiminase
MMKSSLSTDSKAAMKSASTGRGDIVVPSSTVATTTRRMPSEWEPHDACLLLYPHNVQTFRLQQARAEFWNICRAISTIGQEKVIVFCPDEMQARQVRLELLQEQDDANSHGTNNNNQNIEIAVCPSHDTWARDTAPTFVLEQPASNDDDGSSGNTVPKTIVTGIDWGFNAYGKANSVDWHVPSTRQALSIIARRAHSRRWFDSFQWTRDAADDGRMLVASQSQSAIDQGRYCSFIEANLGLYPWYNLATHRFGL